MKENCFPFNCDMVKVLLDGRKLVTRCSLVRALSGTDALNWPCVPYTNKIMKLASRSERPISW